MHSRRRLASKGRPPSSAPTGSHIIIIGNCRLDVPDALGYELSHEGFTAELQDIGTLKVYEAVTRIITPPVGLSFTLLNPKNVDGPGKLLLQDVLHLYNVELPAMSFAANTGKKSPFLESCIMDGKYCTLILRKNEPGNVENELVGAVTFQILPPDTQQAEIPLAAVRHAHQRKGYGALIYKELQRRLVDVGVTSVFCWGDVESEAFWSKIGFVKVAEVDRRGKPRKLPIKGELKKAMSIPGSAALMISHLESGCFPATVSVTEEKPKKREGTTCEQVDNGIPDSPSRFHNAANILEAKNTSSPMNMVTTPAPAGEVKSRLATTPSPTVKKSPELSTAVFQKCGSSVTPLNMEGKIFSIIGDVSFKSDTPEGATEALEVVTNPLDIVSLCVPDSEPLDASDNLVLALPVTPVTNTLPCTKSPGSLKNCIYVRRRQTTASSTTVNLAPNSISSTTSGKEDTAEISLIVDLEGSASREEGKLLAFLGPRTKASERKNGPSILSEISSGQLNSIVVKDDEANLPPSAFNGARNNTVLEPSCNLEVLHGASCHQPADKVDKTAGQKRGNRGETLVNSIRGPKLRRRPLRADIHELQEKTGEEIPKNDDVLFQSSGTGPRVGVKRGRPLKEPTGKEQKKFTEETGGGQMVLPVSGAARNLRTEKTGSIKRSKASASVGEGVRKQIRKDSPSQKISVSGTVSEERDQSFEMDHDNSDNILKTVPPKDHPPLPTSVAAGRKTGLKRGRPAKLVGTRTKRTKADSTRCRGLDNNKMFLEGDAVKSVKYFEQKEGQDGLAEIVNMLVPEHQGASADSIAQESTEVNEGTSRSDCLDSPLRREVQVSYGTSANCNRTLLDQPLRSVGGPFEPPNTAGVKSNQPFEKPKHVIMFMNMADENKKKHLSTHVEKLGGLVTCEGNKCTHVVTMEVRRTLNFCVALSSGAWILSPDWLKASVKQKTFVGEEPYILRDKKFESKYSISLKDVIPKAQQMPNLLLDGLYIYPTPHVHPPVNTISDIIKAAGGQVLETFGEADQLEKKSLGIVLACEEDMGQAMAAAKAGLRTYNSDWLLTCIVKQELDFSVPQITESL